MTNHYIIKKNKLTNFRTKDEKIRVRDLEIM
jgi:hypothetical protein